MLLASPMTAATSAALAPPPQSATSTPTHLSNGLSPRIARIDARLEEFKQKFSAVPRAHMNVPDYMTFFNHPRGGVQPPARTVSAPTSAATTPPNAPSSSSSDHNSPQNPHETRLSRDFHPAPAEENNEKHRSASVGPMPGKDSISPSDHRRRDGQDLLNGFTKDSRQGSNNDKTIRPRVIEKPPTPPMESILKEFEFLINLPKPITPDLPPERIVPPPPPPKTASKDIVRKPAPLPPQHHKSSSSSGSSSSGSGSSSDSDSGSSSSSGGSSSDSGGDSDENAPPRAKGDKDRPLESRSKKRPAKLPDRIGGKTVSKGTKTEGYAKKGLPTKKSRTTGQKSLGPKKVEEITTRAPAERSTFIVRLKIPVRPPAIKEPIVVVARSNKRKDAPAPSKSGKPNEQRERAEENDTEPTPAIASGNPKLMLKLPSQKKRDRPVVESDEEGEVSQEDKKRLKSNRELSSKQAKPKKLVASSATKSAPSPSPTTKDLKRKRAEEFVDTTLKRKRADEAESATEDAPPRKTLVTKRENTSSPGSAGTPPAARLKDNGHEKGQKGKPFSRSPSRERETGRRDEEKRASGKSSLAKEGGPKNNTKTSVADPRRDEIRKEKMASERTARRSMSPSLERSVSPIMRQAPRGKGGDKEKEREGKGDGARTGKDKEKEKDKDKEKDKGARRSSCRSWSRDQGRSRSRSPRRDRERERDRGRGRDADRDRRERDRDNRGRRRSRDKSRDRSRERSKEREKGARDGSRERERVGRSDREKDKDGRKLDKEKDRVSPVTNTGADRRSSVGVGSGARRRTEGENSLVKEETPRKIGSIPLGSKNTANDMMTPPPHQPSSAHHDDKAANNTTPQNPASNAHDVRSGSATATAPNTLSVPSTPSRKQKVTLAELIELKKQRADQGTTPAPIASNGHETDSSGNTPKDIESPASGHPRTPAPSTLPVGAELEHDVSQAQPRTSLVPDSAASPSEVRVKKEGVQTPASSQGNVPKDYIDKWRIAGVRYRELGDNYKHQGDKSSSQASEELASVQWMEGVLSYLQSFYYVELANERDAIRTWESLMPFLNFVKKKQWLWKQWPLFGLCCKIESIVLFHIFSLKEVQFKRRTSRIATTLRSHDTTLEEQRPILVEHLDTITKLFEEFEHVGTRWSESETHLTHEVLRRDFPETWQKCCIEGDVSVGAFEMEGGETAQRFEWPMTHFTGVPRLVAFGRCLLRELVTRKGISFVPIKDF